MLPEVALRPPVITQQTTAADDPVRRVLFVTNMYPNDAQPAFGIIVERLARALQKTGIHIEVESVSGERGSTDYVLARGRIARAARLLGPDLVHVHFGYTALATESSYPRVVSFYGDDLNGESVGTGSRITLKSRVGAAISQWAAIRCERSIAVSEALRDRLWSARARERCEVIRDSVDTDLFRPQPRAEARARLGVAAEAKLVLFPHALSQRTKRVDLARAAVEHLRQMEPRAELWIVNDRAPSEMPLVYAAADVLIVTSDLEGGPSCVKEALACGLPVVSVPVGDTQVLHEAAQACFLAPREPAQLAGALFRALNKRLPRESLLPGTLALHHGVRRIREVYAAAVQARRSNSGHVAVKHG